MSGKRTGKPSRRKQAKKKPRTNWGRLRATSDADIASQIAADADAAPILDDAWFARARVREPGPRKVAISLRVDPDVLDWFKAAGERYQSRMNAVLRAYMEHHRAKRGKPGVPGSG